MPDPTTEPRQDEERDDGPRSQAAAARRPARALPFGPFGMLVVTAVALAAALGAAALYQRLVEDDGAVDVQDALDASTRAPLVRDAEVRAEIGSLAPDVRLEYLDGGVQQLAEVAGLGTPVVLNFWSSTCIPCLKEMPAFEEVRAEMEQEVTFVGVDVADNREDGERMVERTGVRYRNARDPRSEIFTAFGGIALPRTVLIDGDGTVVGTHSGELTAEELRALLAEHELVDG